MGQAMTIREQTQAMEREMLAPWAALSSNTRGRQHPEEECEMRTLTSGTGTGLSTASRSAVSSTRPRCFSPGRDHYRTRLTHTLEVSQIARTIARRCA